MSGSNAARDQLQAALAVDAVRDREADHGVDRPRVEGPVEERGRHRGLRRGGVAGGAGPGGGRHEVADRLADAVEHQADAHAGAEHHRDPGDGPELRLLAVAAEGDVAVAAHGQPQHEHHEAAGGQHEQPAGVVHRPGERLARDAGRGTSVLRNPQTRNATAITAVTPKTTLSRPPWCAERSWTVTSSAGWDPVSVSASAPWSGGRCGSGRGVDDLVGVRDGGILVCRHVEGASQAPPPREVGTRA